MIEPKHLYRYIILPTLSQMYLANDKHSTVAGEILLGIACQESECGRYLYQVPSGPALGIYQMEPNTYDDIWVNFLKFRPELVEVISRVSRGFPGYFYGGFSPVRMQGDLYYATAMARIFLYRVKEPLPKQGDIVGYARYWKQYWNTDRGAGKEYQFIDNWIQYASRAFS
jgi:hypothetical protein